jgi:hypothetical protein
MRGVIEFSAEEIETLRIEAERATATWKDAGVFPRRVYEVERYEFVHEYARGADPATHEKQQRWLKNIKAELAAKRRKSRKGVKNGEQATDQAKRM